MVRCVALVLAVMLAGCFGDDVTTPAPWTPKAKPFAGETTKTARAAHLLIPHELAKQPRPLRPFLGTHQGASDAPHANHSQCSDT